MKTLLILLVLISTKVQALNYTRSKISFIDYGKNNEPHLLLLANGQVLKLEKDNKVLTLFFVEDSLYEFTSDDNRIIKNANPITKSVKSNSNFDSITSDYVPTTVKDLPTLKSYFKEAPYNPKESQCFNRAMVWSYEWWKKHSLKSMKLFIFFTRNYIRKYNFEWWFHVSPYAHVMDGEKVVEKVLDVKYTNGPLSFKQWTDVFMKNDAVCPVITKYSDYADNPYTGDCYIYRSNMYFYQPADLQMNEAWGYDKTNFNMDEVRGAYKEAFDIDL